MRTPRVGLLPLYLAFYDEALPDLRPAMQRFADEIAGQLAGYPLEVVQAAVCCVRSEVEAALLRVAEAKVDLIVTLHLAYHPSLESVDSLARAGVPIVMLDTTPDADFGRTVDPAKLVYNHGIHGVQDLACMLRRRGTPYRVVAGHTSDPSVMARVADIASGTVAAAALRTSRVLRIGEPFRGMGDFAVAADVLGARLGITYDAVSPDSLAADVLAVTDAEVDTAMAANRSAYRVDAQEDVHARSVRLGLGIRRVLERGGYTALTMNFQAFDQPDGPLSTPPFLECCQAQARGIGYAGEGDVLTAAFVGALLQGWGEASFTEMFCADWQGGSVFLSHMGEFNPAIAAPGARIYEKPYPFSAAQNPATIACAPRPGPATLLNLCPGPADTFRLIAAPVEVLGDGTHPSVDDWIRAWVRPEIPVAPFLEEYSTLGGTHHCALLLGRHDDGLRQFAEAAGLECCRVGGAR